VIRCLITNGAASRAESAWLRHIEACMERGVDLVQIREPGLTARQLADLTRKVLRLPNPHATKVLVNDRTDVALACGAHGVHIKEGGAQPDWFRQPGFLVSAACHRVEDVAGLAAADYILLAPIFAPLSKSAAGTALGLDALLDASTRIAVPILALGGVTPENEQSCVDAGAAGIAGISYFE
jgi:thiamine-phosphate pyrophosphorylase